MGINGDKHITVLHRIHNYNTSDEELRKQEKLKDSIK